MVNILKQSHELLHISHEGEDALKFLESIGRVCYRSHERTKEGSGEKFVKMLLDRKHESVIEHCNATVKLITNRGVTHELVRHRVGVAYSQESTRYCSYGDGVRVIEPVEGWDKEPQHKLRWAADIGTACGRYQSALDLGIAPQHARGLLPIDVATTIVVTANFRAWRHIFKMRCDKSAHPQIRHLMLAVRDEFRERIPIIFDD